MSLDDNLFINKEDNNVYIHIKDTTKLPVPNYLYKNEYITTETKQHIYEYLSYMTPFEQKAYLIAFNHLDSSFHITKSNGYKEWLEKMNKK
jgi:hypothetical protein